MIDIQIDDSGIVRLYANGDQVGLISKLKIEADKDRTIPSIEVEMADISKVPDSPDKKDLQRVLDGYKTALNNQKFVIVK